MTHIWETIIWETAFPGNKTIGCGLGLFRMALSLTTGLKLSCKNGISGILDFKKNENLDIFKKIFKNKHEIFLGHFQNRNYVNLFRTFSIVKFLENFQ